MRPGQVSWVGGEGDRETLPQAVIHECIIPLPQIHGHPLYAVLQNPCPTLNKRQALSQTVNHGPSFSQVLLQPPSPQS
ncbi:hypothetical protein AGOR_G00202090 [Albula goreensis]|uniref:Uncharacterized protein n=1 Tax=Albula goreensis TaxID=1534307 RepID=A0A8T3CWQ8_9TELE|nr:hypothetical protein AGOR_G00202090 [Albula goreensis]